MRSKKALLNIITKFTYQIVAMITGLITPRLILGAYGSTYNGAISSVAHFLSMISILTIGIAGATRVELYKTLANKDVEGTSKIVRATEKCFRKVGYSLIVYTVLLAFLVPLLLEGQIPWYDAVLLVFITAIASFGQYYFGQTYYLLLQADQSEYIITSVHIVVNILNMLIAVIMIELNASILFVKLGSSVLCLLYPLFLHYYVRKKYKLIRNVEAGSNLLKQRGAAMFHSIANIIHDNAAIVMLTVFTNAKILSVYTVYYAIVKNIKQIMQNFTTGLEGAFGSMWAKGEIALFKKNFSTYEFLSFAFSSVVFTCTGLLLLPFMQLYTAGITDTNYLIWSFAILVTVAEGIFCLRQPYVTIVQAAGKYRETKKGAMIEAIINVVLSLVLVNIIGLNGVIIGTLAANLFRTCQYAIFSSKHLLNRSLWNFFAKFLWHALNTGITIAIYLPIAQMLSVDDWMMWIVAAMICFVIAVAVTVTTAAIFFRAELKHSFKFFVRMLHKKKKRKIS